MAKFDDSFIKKYGDSFKKAEYIKREWITADDSLMTIEEYAEYINPVYKHVDTSKNATIIAKERKDGGTFLKMSIPLEGNSEAEYDLQYENDYEEGQEIDTESLIFGVECFLEKQHAFVMGDII